MVDVDQSNSQDGLVVGGIDGVELLVQGGVVLAVLSPDEFGLQLLFAFFGDFNGDSSPVVRDHILDVVVSFGILFEGTVGVDDDVDDLVEELPFTGWGRDGNGDLFTSPFSVGSSGLSPFRGQALAEVSVNDVGSFSLDASGADVTFSAQGFSLFANATFVAFGDFGSGESE